MFSIRNFCLQQSDLSQNRQYSYFGIEVAFITSSTIDEYIVYWKHEG